MVWFYTGARGKIRVETSIDSTQNEYVLSIARPRQAVVVERFADVSAFDARLKALETELEQAGCKQIGTPQLLSDAWRGPMTH